MESSASWVYYAEVVFPPAFRISILVALAATPCLIGQAPPVSQSPSANIAGASAPPGPGSSIDLPEAIRRARAYNPQFLTSGIGVSLAEESRRQAKAALLPTVAALNQYVFTQPNGTDTGVFIGNNGTHEFGEQVTTHAEYSFAKRAEYQRTLAAELTAKARVDVAARGLVFTVAQYYYSLVFAQRHLVNARSSLQEAQRFEDLTQQQERGGEVARADVIKAQLQTQQRQRDVLEGETNIEKARVALGVLILPDITQSYTVVDDIQQDAALPNSSEARAQAVTNNPNIRAAELSVQEAQIGIKVARAEYLPTFSVDYFYGLDANRLALHNANGNLNLGSVVVASVNLPVWNWGSTRSKIREAELQQRLSQVDLAQARRDVQAGLETYYLEARAAQAQLPSLRLSLDTAAESLRLTNLRYQGGEASALEVVDAQSTVALARDNYDAGLTRYRLATVNLQTVSGTF
jgi:outer membrane protein TolC